MRHIFGEASLKLMKVGGWGSRVQITKFRFKALKLCMLPAADHRLWQITADYWYKTCRTLFIQLIFVGTCLMGLTLNPSPFYILKFGITWNPPEKPMGLTESMAFTYSNARKCYKPYLKTSSDSVHLPSGLTVSSTFDGRASQPPALQGSCLGASQDGAYVFETAQLRNPRAADSLQNVNHPGIKQGSIGHLKSMHLSHEWWRFTMISIDFNCFQCWMSHSQKVQLDSCLLTHLGGNW